MFTLFSQGYSRHNGTVFPWYEDLQVFYQTYSFSRNSISFSHPVSLTNKGSLHSNPQVSSRFSGMKWMVIPALRTVLSPGRRLTVRSPQSDQRQGRTNIQRKTVFPPRCRSRRTAIRPRLLLRAYPVQCSPLFISARSLLHQQQALPLCGIPNIYRSQKRCMVMVPCRA